MNNSTALTPGTQFLSFPSSLLNVTRHQRWSDDTVEGKGWRKALRQEKTFQRSQTEDKSKGNERRGKKKEVIFLILTSSLRPLAVLSPLSFLSFLHPLPLAFNPSMMYDAALSSQCLFSFPVHSFTLSTEVQHPSFLYFPHSFLLPAPPSHWLKSWILPQ